MRPYNRRYVECRFCAKHVTKNNLGTHVKTHHPARLGDDPASWFMELPADEAIPATIAARTPEPPPGLALPAVAGQDPPPDLPPLDLDDIVLSVVEHIAEPSGMVPVAHLPALFAWREATATFLRAVSHDRH
jgi:hypothetical protein